MERDSSPHDNTDIKISNRVTIYGNVTMIGSISVAGVGLLFLLIWMYNNWAQAITLSAIIVIGLTVMFFLALAALIAALWIRFVIHPGIDARERSAQVQGQELKNQVVWAQPNAIVAVVEGSLQVVPLFPQPRALPAPKEEEKIVDDQTIVEIYNHGATYETIMEQTGWKYNKIQRVISDAKKRGEIPG